MTSREFRRRLLSRPGFEVSLDDTALERLAGYFRLLTTWNRTMNLTGFDLEAPTEEALDRVLREPLAAAPLVQESVTHWLDVGSGGGSPAVPLKIARPDIPLTMVETRGRKAAFLREVSRELGLPETAVVHERVEALKPDAVRAADLLTVRAVRASRRLSAGLAPLLNRHGALFIFGPVRPREWPDFAVRTAAPLLTGVPTSTLTILTRSE